MRYSNPAVAELPENTNEGREFLRLLGGIAVAIVALLAVLLALSDWIAPRLPFGMERSMAKRAGVGEGGPKVPEALAKLNARVVTVLRLQEDMEIQLHYRDSAIVNAGATLGGHVFMYQGLIAKLKSEDALAAVLAHEAGHVRGRHVVKGLSRAIVLIGALSSIGIKSGPLNRRLLGKGTELAALSYSRDAEREADAAALDAVHRLYGHTAGITELFTLFESLDRERGSRVEMMRTHPLSANRLADLDALARQRGYATTGTLTPLPGGLSPRPPGSSSASPRTTP